MRCTKTNKKGAPDPPLFFRALTMPAPAKMEGSSSGRSVYYGKNEEAEEVEENRRSSSKGGRKGGGYDDDDDSVVAILATGSSSSSSSSSVWLSWRPGFDGGLPQTFFVKYGADRIARVPGVGAAAASGRDACADRCDRSVMMGSDSSSSGSNNCCVNGSYVLFRLTGLEPDHEYEMAAFAKNAIGESRLSNQILVKTGGIT